MQCTPTTSPPFSVPIYPPLHQPPPYLEQVQQYTRTRPERDTDVEEETPTYTHAHTDAPHLHRHTDTQKHLLDVYHMSRWTQQYTHMQEQQQGHMSTFTHIQQQLSPSSSLYHHFYPPLHPWITEYLYQHQPPTIIDKVATREDTAPYPPTHSSPTHSSAPLPLHLYPHLHLHLPPAQIRMLPRRPIFHHHSCLPLCPSTPHDGVHSSHMHSPQHEPVQRQTAAAVDEDDQYSECLYTALYTDEHELSEEEAERYFRDTQFDQSSLSSRLQSQSQSQSQSHTELDNIGNPSSSTSQTQHEREDAASAFPLHLVAPLNAGCVWDGCETEMWDVVARLINRCGEASPAATAKDQAWNDLYR